jgi:hypothetical protein
LELKNESSSFGQKDLQELQSRAATRHRLHHLFLGCSAQTEAGLSARFFSRAARLSGGSHRPVGSWREAPRKARRIDF